MPILTTLPEVFNVVREGVAFVVGIMFTCDSLDLVVIFGERESIASEVVTL